MEKETARFWEKERIYKTDFSKKKTYSIDTPPPTVSGNMHMGHAFMYSQMDFIARFRRMIGYGVFYPFGTDDNGIPTEKLVEKINGVKSMEMSRNDFIGLCIKTLKEILPGFVEDWKKLGISCDYEKVYSTIDDNSRKISQKYFIDAYKKGLIYKKDFPTIWDIVFQTPVAQAELEDKEMETLFSTVKFQIKNSKDHVLIATTRPELLGACVAVFINPKDKKHKGLIGKRALVPLFNHEVPIISDESADMEKGTGVLMVCSYGDKYDVEAIQRHKLKPKIVLNRNGTLNIEGYEGMSIKDARKKIIQSLEKNKLITSQKKISHVVNVYEKSGVEIEFLPAEQWFFKILGYRKDLLKKAREIRWLPKHMIKRYENWVNGLEWDWIISRERHFGVPIPAWHCSSCNETILAKDSELPIDPMAVEKKCPRCNLPALPEEKVLDTWATSSLTPQIASSVFGNKVKVPYSLRPQGHDIIRTWAFYTIVRSLLHEKKIPWKDIFITGNVTLKGEKMSKSKGNVVSPQDVLEKYGADALRYWASSSKLGEDFEYQEKDVLTGKRLVNKLSNAANFVFMNMGDFDFKKPKKLEAIDSIFLNQLSHLVNEAGKAFENYEYSKAKLMTENFFWKEFADNYIEIVKKRVYQGKGNEKKSAQYTLYHSLLSILKMFAPIIPFVTEEIYQKHYKKDEKTKSIHLCGWPEGKKAKNADEWTKITSYISKVRQEKTKYKKSMNAPVESITIPNKDYKVIINYKEPFLAVSGSITLNSGPKFKVNFPKSATGEKI